MKKQEYIDEKRKKIADINEAQEKICKDIEALSKSPYVDFKTAVTNATQIVQWVVMARSMEASKHLIAAQPFPKYSPSGELAIVGESGEEEIIQA
jgi:hypothetical protein